MRSSMVFMPCPRGPTWRSTKWSVVFNRFRLLDGAVRGEVGIANIGFSGCLGLVWEGGDFSKQFSVNSVQ